MTLQVHVLEPIEVQEILLVAVVENHHLRRQVRPRLLYLQIILTLIPLLAVLHLPLPQTHVMTLLQLYYLRLRRLQLG